MLDILLDALLDSVKALPFLLAIYLLIEFLENSEKARARTVKLLNGKLAPLVAGSVGLIPQCGFSVMATDLYCQNYLKLGTLIAFFVATSDEALPILLTNSQTAGIVWVVMLVKVVYAVVLGFVFNALDRRTLSSTYNLAQTTGCCNHNLGGDSTEHPLQDQANCHSDEEHCHHHEEHCHSDLNTQQQSTSKGRKVWNFLKHPLLHTLKIFLYIFVVNFVFGTLLHFAEQPILQFASQLGFFQSFFTALIGLVPNCASSVIITGMYTEGIINLSAMLAGLVTNSGLAFAILFRNKHYKRAFAIMGTMYAAGVVLGVATYFLFPLLGL